MPGAGRNAPLRPADQYAGDLGGSTPTARTYSSASGAICRLTGSRVHKLTGANAASSRPNTAPYGGYKRRTALRLDCSKTRLKVREAQEAALADSAEGQPFCAVDQRVLERDAAADRLLQNARVAARLVPERRRASMLAVQCSSSMGRWVVSAPDVC